MRYSQQYNSVSLTQQMQERARQGSTWDQMEGTYNSRQWTEEKKTNNRG
jgi:hypothetical protein